MPHLLPEPPSVTRLAKELGSLSGPNHRCFSSRTFPLSGETSCTAAISSFCIGVVALGSAVAPDNPSHVATWVWLPSRPTTTMPRFCAGVLPLWPQSPYEQAMSMRVPQPKPDSEIDALVGGSETLVISSAWTVSCGVEFPRPTISGRTGTTTPTASSAAATPTAAEVTHRDRLRRHRPFPRPHPRP